MSEAASLNYFRLWIGDYGKDTSRLSLAEHGAYLLLLLEYYSSGPLPDDVGELHRICRALSADEQQAVGKVAKRFFPVNGDGRRHNKRADEELEIARVAIESQRQAGRATAEKRWGKGDRSTNSSTDSSGGRSIGRAFQPLSPLASLPVQPPASQPPTPQAETGSAVAAERRTSPAPTSETWEAYAVAYQERYGVMPVRNAKVNGNLKRFLERVPIEEAPAIAAFYVRSNNAYYTRRRHATDCLLKDAEGLTTEWRTGQQMTDTRARQVDRTQATANAFAPLIADAERRERISDAGK